MNFTDRRFSDFINVLNDFHTVPPSEYAKTTPEDIEIYGLPDTARQRSMNNIADKLLHDEENTNSKKNSYNTFYMLTWIQVSILFCLKPPYLFCINY